MSNELGQPRAVVRTLAVVLNWCAEEDTAACVASLLLDGTPGLDVLIVDNASPDDSGARLAARFPSMPFLQTGENLGYAGGNLRAMEWALARGYDFVLVCNDDAEVWPGCVGALLSAMAAEPRVGACAPTIVHGGHGGGEDIIWWAGGRVQWYKAQGTHEHFGRPLSSLKPVGATPEPAEFLSGCVVLFRASALRACGGFRAEFFAYVEDLELSVRLTRAGWALRWVPGAVAVHKVPYPPPEASAFAIRWRDCNRRRFVALHYGRLRRVTFAAWFYPTRMVHVVRYAVRADWARCGAIVAGAVKRDSRVSGTG